MTKGRVSMNNVLRGTYKEATKASLKYYPGLHTNELSNTMKDLKGELVNI
jgi:hypothetical protein